MFFEVEAGSFAHLRILACGTTFDAAVTFSQGRFIQLRAEENLGVQLTSAVEVLLPDFQLSLLGEVCSVSDREPAMVTIEVDQVLDLGKSVEWSSRFFSPVQRADFKVVSGSR